MSEGMYTMWASPHSYYTGKIRSYFIKKGLPYREECLFHPRFRQASSPRCGFSLPRSSRRPTGASSRTRRT